MRIVKGRLSRCFDLKHSNSARQPAEGCPASGASVSAACAHRAEAEKAAASARKGLSHLNKMWQPLKIQFIFSGLTAVLGSREIREAPQFMAVLSQTDIGSSAIETLKHIAEAQHRDRSGAPV